MNHSFPQTFKVVQGLKPSLTNVNANADIVSLKNWQKAVVLVEHNQAAANVTTVKLYQADNVAGGNAKVLAVNVPIWSNEDTANTDALTKSEGVNFAFSDAQVAKQLLFEVPASALDVSNGFDCLFAGFTGGAATSILSVSYVLVGGRIQGATPPTAITD